MKHNRKALDKGENGQVSCKHRNKQINTALSNQQDYWMPVVTKFELLFFNNLNKNWANNINRPNLKKWMEMKPATSAKEIRKKPTDLFFQIDWNNSAVWLKLQYVGAIARTENRPKYMICAKCGETAWASFAPVVDTSRDSSNKDTFTCYIVENKKKKQKEGSIPRTILPFQQTKATKTANTIIYGLKETTNSNFMCHSFWKMALVSWIIPAI